MYLRYLFVAYDKAVCISGDNISNWPWYSIIRDAVMNDDISEVSIITYNYDIWLERVLRAKDIRFGIATLEEISSSRKIKIFKPHGSISFAHNRKMDLAAFHISYDRELPDAPASDFHVAYDDLDSYYLVNAMIPPAADSGRFNQTWANQIREDIRQMTKTLTSDDEVIICGTSYWHVDRSEIDELLIALPQDINIKMVNPSPSRSLNTVITSLFSNYISYSSASELKGVGLYESAVAQ